MERKKFTLCPLCEACPEVEITDQGVTIGEDANVVRLSHAEWNELVRLVKSGELCEVSGIGTASAKSKT
jgi:sarcosine oxidase delta subunit